MIANKKSCKTCIFFDPFKLSKGKTYLILKGGSPNAIKGDCRNEKSEHVTTYSSFKCGFYAKS